MLSAGQIHSKLSEYECTFINNQESLEVEDIRFITSKTETVESKILYLGTVSQFSSSMLRFQKGNFLLVEDVEFSSVPQSLEGNYILLGECTDLLEVFNEIKSMLSQNLQSMKNATNLLNTLIHSRGLKYIIKRSSEILNNPVILLDNSFRIIAYSKVDKIEEEFWQENIKRGYCTFEFISEVKKIDALKKAPLSADPFIVTCFASPNKKLVSKVIVDEKVVGFIVVLENQEKITEKSNEFLSLLSNVISQEINSNKEFSNMVGLMHENLLVDILEGRIEDHDIIEERIKSSEIAIKDKFQVLVFNISKYKPSMYYRDNLKQGLSAIFKSIYPIFYKDYVVALLNFEHDEPMDSSTEQRLKEFLKDNNLTVGVSQVFNSLIKLKDQYRKTLKALELGSQINSDEKLFYSEKFNFYVLLDFLATNNLSQDELKGFCHTAVQKIQKFDEDNDTQYSQTLYHFLLNNQNINKTANELFIHRNTMGYRLNKIREITSINFEDTETVFNIQMSYKIQQYFRLASK
ncbi:helix-turn-helix domain-containing protein [Proteinivorax hydrogeniformans]|uniref:Helix-turn-helix domain-containing protein n=1 Tax=Proteinivorax hydrogeniformans TaxID=1826727 RepID=A0AAU8HVC7_9FIRM